jgi:hypothetical protein
MMPMLDAPASEPGRVLVVEPAGARQEARPCLTKPLDLAAVLNVIVETLKCDTIP